MVIKQFYKCFSDRSVTKRRYIPTSCIIMNIKTPFYIIFICRFPDFVTQKTCILQLSDKQYFVSLCHLILGDTKNILTMFVRKKRYPSGNIGVIVVEKIGDKMNELATIGVAYHEGEVENLVNEAKEWISRENSRRQPQLDLFGEEREACDREREEVRRVLSNVSNIFLNGCDLILDRTFDRVGFNRIDDDVFRKLVKARLAYPTSKAATVEYLKNHFDEDMDLSKIYRYLDKLSDHQHEIVQDISVHHTAKLFGGNIGVLFYDVTTLYFEADYEDELRKAGFSKEGRHSNPQIILGLLVSLGGYPLAYCIHEGNKYEGHTMLPTINEFVSKYGLENFVVVADSGLMNNANIAELESHGYKYIIGAKIKNERYWNSPSATARWLNMTKEADAVSWLTIQMTVQRKMPITGKKVYAGWKKLTSMVPSLKVTSTREVTISSYPWMVK